MCVRAQAATFAFPSSRLAFAVRPRLRPGLYLRYLKRMSSDSVNGYLDALDATYVALHTAKEDAFWSAKMGLSPDPLSAQNELDTKDIELQRFLQDPEQLLRARAMQ